MEINVFRRYEKKFLLTLEQWQSLLPTLESHMDIDPFCLNKQPYNVRTVYFDTDDYDVIRKSLDGPQFKEKLRMRKYGHYDVISDEVYFEIKRKFKGIGTKRRVKCTESEVDSLIKQGTMPVRTDYYAVQILNEIGYYLSVNKVKPAVFISYRRLAYTDRENKQFRLTIDQDILTRRDDFDFSHGPKGRHLIDDNHRLMEVKVGKAMPLWFAQALSEHKIYLTSFSKYGKDFESRMKKEFDPDEYI